MRKWAEVIQEIPTSMGRITQKLAALDVTGEPDGGEQTMKDLKDTYGAEVIYQWHTCAHDDRASCSVTEV